MGFDFFFRFVDQLDDNSFAGRWKRGRRENFLYVFPHIVSLGFNGSKPPEDKLSHGNLYYGLDKLKFFNPLELN